MALTYENGFVEMFPGPMDVHGHPRAFDPITDHDISGLNGYEGKAGLPAYTETALSSGFVVVSAMPNEFYRVLDDTKADGTNLIQLPVATLDRARFMEMSIATQSRMHMTYHLGLDPSRLIYGDSEWLNVGMLISNFEAAGQNCTALKIFGDVSTGGNNVPTHHIPQIAREWNQLHPNKPIIMHLEDGNVRAVLEQMYSEYGRRVIPMHIAHVSSQEELEAVIWAKEMGMNVTCEATPHHLFATAEDGKQIGGYGCMKPTLKPAEDVKFLWDNIDQIDIFASDCAPHKPSDKEANPPAFGVSNHTVMMPLLFGAVEKGLISLEDLYQKLVINPRQRFNVPMKDGTHAIFDMRKGYDNAEEVERIINPSYGQNIFPKLEQLGNSFHLLGHLVSVKSGQSSAKLNDLGILVPHFGTSLTHLRKVS